MKLSKPGEVRRNDNTQSKTVSSLCLSGLLESSESFRFKIKCLIKHKEKQRIFISQTKIKKLNWMIRTKSYIYLREKKKTKVEEAFWNIDELSLCFFLISSVRKKVYLFSMVKHYICNRIKTKYIKRKTQFKPSCFRKNIIFSLVNLKPRVNCKKRSARSV